MIWPGAAALFALAKFDRQKIGPPLAGGSEGAAEVEPDDAGVVGLVGAVGVGPVAGVAGLATGAAAVAGSGADEAAKRDQANAPTTIAAQKTRKILMGIGLRLRRSGGSGR
jgi:hypothetical protein